MEIRLMKNDEVEKVKELMFKTLSRKSSKKYANSKTSFTVVADIDSDIVGVATVFIHDDEFVDEKTYFVSNLCVAQKFQRMGIATKIINFIEEIGKKENIK